MYAEEVSEVMRTFHEKYYRPQHMALSLVGPQVGYISLIPLHSVSTLASHYKTATVKTNSKTNHSLSLNVINVTPFIVCRGIEAASTYTLC